MSHPSPYAAGLAIVDLEARRDGNGFPALYELPANDGGGRWEIAGINERYHPEALATLRRLPPQKREAWAAQYIEEWTLRGTRLDLVALRPGTRFAVLDATFNRGPGGSAWIVQHALRALGRMVDLDGRWGPQTRGELARADRDPVQAHGLASRLRLSREAYEREKVGYRANLWAGLSNRWNKVETLARRMNVE